MFYYQNIVISRLQDPPNVNIKMRFIFKKIWNCELELFDKKNLQLYFKNNFLFGALVHKDNFVTQDDIEDIASWLESAKTVLEDYVANTPGLERAYQ